MALTVATLVPEYVQGSEHFAGIHVESSGVPVDKYGRPSPDAPFRLFQTFTDADTRAFRSIASTSGATWRPLD